MKKTGIELIADERQRQITKEGWTPEHDDQHKIGELSEAAVCYVTVGSAMIRGSSADEWPPEMVNGFGDNLLTWPWDDKWWKPSNCVLTNLVKAGALIAAEIDRLQRAAGVAPEPGSDRFTHDQIIGWMARNGFDGSLHAARTAMEDAHSLQPGHEQSN